MNEKFTFNYPMFICWFNGSGTKTGGEEFYVFKVLKKIRNII